MFQIGDKIVYGEHGVCTVLSIGTLSMQGIRKDQQFYTLKPLCSDGTIYAPVDSGVYMRPVMDRETARALLARIPEIPPAVCQEARITRADAYYKSVFSSHSCEALIALLKGLYQNGQFTCRKGALNLRLDRIGKRARDLLDGEFAVALDISPDAAATQLEELLSAGVQQTGT